MFEDAYMETYGKDVIKTILSPSILCIICVFNHYCTVINTDHNFIAFSAYGLQTTFSDAHIDKTFSYRYNTINEIPQNGIV